MVGKTAGRADRTVIYLFRKLSFSRNGRGAKDRMDYHMETFEELVKNRVVCRHDGGNFSPAAGMQRAGKAALKVCEEPDGPYFYAVALEQDQELIAGLEQELASVVQTASEPSSRGICRNGLVRCERCFRFPCSAGAGHFYARMAQKG